MPITEHNITEIKRQIQDMGLTENITVFVAKEVFSMRQAKCIEYCKKNADLSPTHVVIELSSYCNLKCEFCIFHGYLNKNVSREAFMAWETIKELVRQMKEWNSIEKLSCFHSGEEFLNPEWYEMLSYILGQIHIPELFLSTNGMLLNEENIKKISNLQCENITLLVSFSGESEAECERWRRNMDYRKVKENILLAKSFLPSHVQIKLNVDYMIDKESAKAAGYIIENMKYEVPKYLQKDFGDIECFAGPTVLYEDVSCRAYEGLSVVQAKYQNSACLNLFNEICIDSQGYVLNCACNGGLHRLGNVMSENALDIWRNNKTMVEGREKILQRGEEPQICANCSYGGELFHMLVKNNGD